MTDVREVRVRKAWCGGITLFCMLVGGWQLADIVQASPDVPPEIAMASKEAGETKVSASKSAKESKMSHREKMLRERYAPISTQPSTILVKVQDEKSGEVLAVVCDHEYWVNTNKRLNHDKISQKEYEDLMIAQGGKPFVLDSATFAKFKPLATPEPSAAMRALSMDDIAAKYLVEPKYRNSAWTVKDPERMDKVFVRLLLEKGCVVNYSCLDGSALIKW